MIKCKSLGKDWAWGNQDGGAGNIGTVLSVEGSGQVLVCTTYFLTYFVFFHCFFVNETMFNQMIYSRNVSLLMLVII